MKSVRKGRNACTDLAERNAQLAAELAAERANAQKATAEYAALAERLETTSG